MKLLPNGMDETTTLLLGQLLLVASESPEPRSTARDRRLTVEFRNLLEHFVAIRGEPEARAVVRTCNGLLYTSMGFTNFPMPPVWEQFVAAYGDDFVQTLAHEGQTAIRMQIVHAMERNLQGVYNTLRKANLLQ